jgi:hypothetical protein
MTPRRRNRISSAFAPKRIEMLESPAFRALSLSAHRLLARLEIEFASHGGRDNGKLPTTYEQFEKYGIDRHSIAPAIREAEALGFVEVTERGRAGNREFRAPSLYRLTYRHTDRADPTDEWKRVDTIADAKEIATRARNPRRAQKQNASGGISQVSVGETHTENRKSPVGESHTAARVKTHTTSISRGGSARRAKAL